MEVILEVVENYILNKTPTHILRKSNKMHYNGYCIRHDDKNLLFNDRFDGMIAIPLDDIDAVEKNKFIGDVDGKKQD